MQSKNNTVLESAAIKKSMILKNNGSKAIGKRKDEKSIE